MKLALNRSCFQINKVHVREVNRGPDYTPRFELERRDDGRREVLRTDEIPGKTAKPEVAWIVVQVRYTDRLMERESDRLAD